MMAGVSLSLKTNDFPSASRASSEPRRNASINRELSGKGTSSNWPLGIVASRLNAAPLSRTSRIGSFALGVNDHFGLINPSHQRYSPVTNTNKLIPLS
jgi:hypothetical protein